MASDEWSIRGERPSPEGPLEDGAGKPAERPMGSLKVVFVKPMLRCFARFSDRLEEPAIQTSVSKDAVE